MTPVAYLKDAILAVPGFHTNRKIVIFESDDWGSLRIPSNDAYRALAGAGLDVTTGDSDRYNRWDSLESAQDLHALFDTLCRFKDVNGRHPVITAYCLVANPDFERIEADRFRAYWPEDLSLTLARHHGSEQVLRLWREGYQNQLFVPEFHGREHLNVAQWMKALQANDAQTITGFRHHAWCFNNVNRYSISYLAAFDVGEPSELSQQADILQDGLDRFERIMGYRALAFVPPNGIMANALYPVAAGAGIRYMFSAQRNRLARGQGRYHTHWNYLGKKNGYGQRIIIRNSFFEPSDTSQNAVEACLAQMERVFVQRRPAIIGTHRVNFVGSRSEANRTNGLQQLYELLGHMLKRWPEIEFMSTRELGGLIDLP